MTSLYALSAEYQEALEALSDPEIPPEAVYDTLEGLQFPVVDKARNVGAFILNMDVQLEAMKMVEKRISDRRKALERKITQMREYLRSNMERCGIKKIEALDGTFSATLIAPSARVVIENEAQLPPDYFREKIIQEPDKELIARALKDDALVPGARLEYKPGLRLG